MAGIDETIKQLNMFPVVPTINYNGIPFVPWNSAEFQLNTADSFSIDYDRTYINKRGKEKRQVGHVTGAVLITGKPSGVMVVDLDVGHKKDENGIATFNEIWPDSVDTFTVQSSGGGLHLYFKYRKGLKNDSAYFPGIDVRTDGGCIMLPGSIKRLNDGSLGNYQILVESPIAEMPDELFQKFLAAGKPEKTKKPRQRRQTGLLDGYNAGAIPEGHRNDTLFKLAIEFFSHSSIRDDVTIKAFVQGLNLQFCKPALQENDVDTITKSIIGRLYPEWCDEKGNVIPYTLVTYIRKNHPSYARGNLYFIYDTDKGVYQSMEPQDLYKLYFDYCTSDKDRTPAKAKSFADLMVMASQEIEQRYDEKRFVNCLNGVINLETGELYTHDPKFRLECQFQANYCKWSDLQFQSSQFKRFLDDTLDSETQITVQEALGLFISPHASEVQTAFAFLGNGSNGKSVLMMVMLALIGGHDYVSSIGLAEFLKDFDISQAEGKHVNIVMDDDLTGVKVGGSFKSMICGENLRVNRKHKDITTQAFNMTHFFGLNRLPAAVDKSLGFYRRFCIIPFHNTFGTPEDVAVGKASKIKDPSLAKRIIDNELDLVFNWALQGLYGLRENNWKLTISKACQAEKELYKEESDSAYAFYKEKIRGMPGNTVPVSVVWERYNWFCAENGITKPMDGRNLGKQLKSFGIKSNRNKKFRYYEDIKIEE